MNGPASLMRGKSLTCRPIWAWQSHWAKSAHCWSPVGRLTYSSLLI